MAESAAGGILSLRGCLSFGSARSRPSPRIAAALFVCRRVVFLRPPSNAWPRLSCTVIRLGNTSPSRCCAGFFHAREVASMRDEVETATNLNATPRVEVEREPPTRITEMRWGQTTTVWWSWSWRTMVSANPLVMLFDAIAGSATWDAIAGLRFQWGADETTTTRGYSGVANVGCGGARAGASGLFLR